MFFRKKTDSEKRKPRILQYKSPRTVVKQTSSLSGHSMSSTDQKPQKPGLFKFTMTVLYKNLYVLGITLLRRRLRMNRALRRSFSKMRGAVYSRLESMVFSVKGFFRKFRSRIRAPFLRIKRTYNEVKPDIRVKRARGKLPLREYGAVLEAVLRLIYKIFATIFNYTAPVLAAVAFVVIISRTISQPLVVAVQYKGEYIGYIQKDSDFNDATQDVRSRVTTDGETAFEIYNPHFETMTLQKFNRKRANGEIPLTAGELDTAKLADRLIRMSGSEVHEAYGLYVDDRFLGAVIEKNPILHEFDRIKSESLTGKPDEDVDFVKSIRLKPGLYPQNSITSESNVIDVISGNETADEIYIVKAGDTPSGISDKTGVSYDVLKELNPEIEDRLVEGMEIYTRVAKPYMSVQTSYTDIVEEEVPFESVKVENATYAKGYTNIFQEGVNGLRRTVYKVKSVDGLERERTELSYEMIKHPVTERVTVGINDPVRQPTWGSGSTGQSGSTSQSGGTQTTTRPQAPVQAAPSSSGFIRPVPAGVGYISCYLNGYRGHTGIDIAVIGGTGTPILASASGTVVKAMNTNVGYGRYIVIDHGNGYQTLYAHNSALYVSTGDRVAQGQVIAGMGRTGNATGVHCHFEIRYNGQIMNPVNYIGNR